MWVDVLILASLRAQPRHGYEIKRSIEQIFGGMFSLTNSTLYPALKRYEEMGAVARQVVRQEGKPDRHIFSLTDRGEAVLHDVLCDFPPEVARREAEFLVRIAFLALLAPEERIAVLETRQSMVRQRRANLPRLREGLRDPLLAPDIERLIALREDQWQVELEWIETALAEQRRWLPDPVGHSEES